MTDLLDSGCLAETYVNQVYSRDRIPGGYIETIARRWWCDPRVLIGGSINDAADWEHLKASYGVTHVISVESEHVDDGKVPDDVRVYLPHPDDGTPFPRAIWDSIVEFARAALMDPGAKLYVHCQQGGSRSPAAAYAVLRTVMGLTQEEALARLRKFKPEYAAPGHPYARSYLASFEEA